MVLTAHSPVASAAGWETQRGQRSAVMWAAATRRTSAQKFTPEPALACCVAMAAWTSCLTWKVGALEGEAEGSAVGARVGSDVGLGDGAADAGGSGSFFIIAIKQKQLGWLADLTNIAWIM